MSSSLNITNLWYVRGTGNIPLVFKKQSCQPYSNYNSRNLRIASTINTYSGGRIQFGNTYLGGFRGFEFNYLGRSEGMPGGSGIPIKNKF
jgi:hypothetical protein